MSRKVTTKINYHSRVRAKLFLKLVMAIKGTTMTQVSREMHHNKSYINTSIDTLNVTPLSAFLKRLSKQLGISAVEVISVLYGNKDLLHQEQHKCAVKLGVPYVKKHLSKYQLKHKFNSQSKINIFKKAQPNTDEIILLSKLIRVSPVTIGEKFGFCGSQLAKLSSIGVNPINRELTKLRRKNHLSQQDVAKKLHVYQTAVSGYERQHLPRPLTIFKLARIYHTTPLHLLKFMNNYQYIQGNSPSYKLMKLCDKQNLSSNAISKIAHIPAYITVNILNHKQSNKDKVIKAHANKIEKAFHLPKNYFGSTETKGSHRLVIFHKKAKKHNIKPNYFGYKLMTAMIKNGLTLRSFANKFNKQYYGHVRDKNHKAGITYQSIQLMKTAKTAHTYRENQIKDFIKTLPVK